ncbi:melatonin receptor type 1A-like [Mercenaria mercenaria]|uniref:melatonin receptor type 1A-like n=1 Tax=Mercenaria mercenaria TaxID=6596 RepID=UPI00234F72F7|nr:melatonin receptor type 1A-like [Mercenaria mercenaria]
MDIFMNSSMDIHVTRNITPPIIKGTGELHYRRYEFVTLRPEIAIPTLVVLFLATVIGTGGNIITLLVFARRRIMRNIESIFLINLVLSDLYVTSVADPMSIIAKIEGEDFFAEVPGLCQIVASLCTVSCVTSLMTIGLMSVNRFFYICMHEKYERLFTKRKCICICISLYIVGGFLVLLNAANVGDHGFDSKSLECIWDRMATYPYTVVFSITLVWIPSIIISICYLKIYLYVRAHKKRMREKYVSSKLRSFHLAKTIFFIYIVFVTCWAPYALLLVVDSNNTFPHEIHVFITMFAHLHPSINWFIYYKTNKKLAAAYRNLFQRCKIVSSDTDSSTDGLSSSKSKTSKQTPIEHSTDTLL